MGSAVGMISTICLLAGVGVLFGAYYLIVNTGVEYEYILTNTIWILTRSSASANAAVC